MDVRCEKCQTEYELDEGKLKPGGVTVKCTTCGHMFKVRRRPSGHASSLPLPPEARAPLSDGEDGDRTWLVRLEDGEIKTCRELSTLQKWIVSGRVTRECAISRTGKKWKPLGEIGELASFFAIADEAREARASGKFGGTVTKEYPKEDAKSGGHPRTVPRRSSSGGGGDQSGGGGFTPTAAGQGGAPVQDLLDTLKDLKPLGPIAPPEENKPAVGGGGAAAAVAAAGMNPIFTRTLPLGTPLPPGARGANNTGRPAGQSRPVEDQPTISSPEESAALARAAEEAAESYSRPAVGSPVPAAAVAPMYGAAAPSTAGWASQGHVPGAMSSGESGPTAGMARPSRSGEAAFVSAKQPGKLPDIRGEYENGRFVPTYYTEDDLVIPGRNRTGLWIILVSLVLLAGAAIAVYMFLYTGGDDEEATGQPAATAAIDAGAATQPAQPTAPPPALDQSVAGALAALGADADQALETAAENLAGLASQPGAAASAPFLVARARVENALAQRLADRARLAASPAEGKPHSDRSRTRAAAAHAAANAALAIEGDHKAAAQVALADARRLEGEKTVEVERILRQARQGPPVPPEDLIREADLVAALLLIRDERLRDARVALDQLARQAPGDVRVRFRLAWLDFLDGNTGAARTGAEAVLAGQPDHGGAKALLEKLGAAAPPAEPKPTEPKPTEPKPTEPKPTGDKPAPPKPPAEESIPATLKRANKLAENGNCDGAMPLFRKVLDDSPSSVEALTGLGFCHLDRREYASAHTRFRAALGISSRYQDAMWGIAELYQRQGNKEEAIAKYQEFIDAFPSTRRAAAARQKIEKLRGESGEGGGGDSSGGDPTPPDPQVDPGDDIP
jgi:predicted Zn finger-like uncharacterized protein